jgi:hypothetical protein
MPFIFTEIVRCGEIGRNAILSFHKHHPHLELNIFAGPDDIVHIPENSHNRIHIVDPNSEIYKAFNNGHLGTAILWQSIFSAHPNEVLVHFDSDVYFFGDIVNDILEKMKTADLVGSFRPYKNNPNNMDNVRGYADCVQTYCFGVNTSKITITDKVSMVNMIAGYLWRHPVIDFFDPVTFHILENGGTIEYIDIDVIGGVDTMGGRQNKYTGVGNDYCEVGDKIVHFAGVGSGRNFYTMLQKGQHINVSESYVQFGLERYNNYTLAMFGSSIINKESNKPEFVKYIRSRIQLESSV